MNDDDMFARPATYNEAYPPGSAAELFYQTDPTVPLREAAEAILAASRQQDSRPVSNEVGAPHVTTSTTGRPVPNQPTDSEPRDETWQEIDLRPVVAGLTTGTITRPTTTVGRRTDGVCLFYAGRVNSVFGESGDGKTWILLLVVLLEILAGHHVLWVDFEDDEYGIVGRLLDLGVDPALIVEYFHYFSPNEPYGLIAEERVSHLIRTVNPTVAIVDSAGESMSIEGVKSNDDDSVARWNRRLPRAIAKLGPAVVVVDHVPKVRDGALFAIGSQRKRAAVTGAAYLVEIIREFGQGRDGRSKLTCAKDRCGTFVRGTRAAEFILDATTNPITAQLVPPETSTSDAGDFRPTALMEKVSRWVEVNPRATKNMIKAAVNGKREYRDQAIELLITDNWITAEPGPNRSQLHRSARPFRDTPDPSEAR